MILIINWLLFLGVVAYTIGLFVYVLETRTASVKLGIKEEFKRNLKERINALFINDFGQVNNNSKIYIGGKTGCYHC